MGWSWWIADAYQAFGLAYVVSWIVVVIASIVLHELAHGWAAIRLGDDTPIHTGHMTWNPVVHMGPTSMIMFAVFGFAWGAMPVDPTRLRGRYAEVLVLLAGPTMNLLLAIVLAAAGAVWARFAVPVGDPLFTNVNTFFSIGVTLNLFLLVLNLLPVYPLDGGRVAADLIRPYGDFVRSEHGGWLSLGVLLLFFNFVGPWVFAIAEVLTGVMLAVGEAVLRLI